MDAVYNKIKQVLAEAKVSAMSFYANQSVLWLSTWVLYLLGAFSISLVAISDKIFPLHLLSKIYSSQQVIDALGSKAEAQTFVFTIKALLALLGILLIIIGMLLAKLRQQSKLYRGFYNKVEEISKLVPTPPDNSSNNHHTLQALSAKDLPDFKGQ
jgi:beta-lactamase regulating signal transducer with metallopeptidase domain